MRFVDPVVLPEPFFGAGRFHRGMHESGIETPILCQLPLLVFGLGAVVRGCAPPRAGGFAPMDRSPSGSVHAKLLASGGSSSAGRASVCGTECRGFNPRLPPQPSFPRSFKSHAVVSFTLRKDLNCETKGIGIEAQPGRKRSSRPRPQARRVHVSATHDCVSTTRSLSARKALATRWRKRRLFEAPGVPNGNHAGV
jgi:hypothetical protein